MSRTLLTILAALTVYTSPWVSPCAGAGTGSVPERVDALLAPLAPGSRSSTGILLDRVVDLVRLGRFDGGRSATAAGAAEWRAAHDQLRRAAFRSPGWPSPERVRALARAADRAGVVPLGFLDVRYERLRDDVFESGAVVRGNEALLPGDPRADLFATHRALVFAPLAGPVGVGDHVVFRLLPELVLRSGGTASDFDSIDDVPGDGAAGGVTGIAALRSYRSFEIDFGDGRGFVAMSARAALAEHRIRYASAGTKEIRVRVIDREGTVGQGKARFEVSRLGVPAPDDTLEVTASIPYLGQTASGSAYVLLADGRTEITHPIVVVEGFDLDNSLDWDGLYGLLNQENLIEDLRAAGHDAVVLDFADATDYLQRNAFVLVELLQQLQTIIGPDRSFPLAGASMGGIVSSYALAYMESQSLPHGVDLWISVDAPHQGAAIPLGMQYWLAFFADQSADAQALLDALNSPAALQMLTYHYEDPPASAPSADPLRAVWLADVAAVGGHPDQPRRVGMANGNGLQIGQGFAPLEQIVEWEYSSFLVDITGNIFAVPDGATGTVFDGLISIVLVGTESQNVVVGGTDPYDNAPGGKRNSMEQMDGVEAPYGDIVALHPNHCFVPTVSALDVSGAGLFEDLAGDPDLLSRTPFAALYFPETNEDHVEITAASKDFLIQEVLAVSSAPGVASLERPELRIASVGPNPSFGHASVRFRLERAESVSASIYDLAGRNQSTWDLGRRDPGEHRFDLDLLGSGARRLPAGVYFLELRSGDARDRAKLVVR